MVESHFQIGGWIDGLGAWIGGAIGWVEHYITPIILIVLLGVEIYVVWLIQREERERERHIRAVHDHTSILSRKLYEVVIQEEMRHAKKLIYCYWQSLHAVPAVDGAAERYAKINEELIAAAEKDDFDVRLVVARDPSRIPGAYQLHKAGVPIRFQRTLLVSDLRFSLFDEAMTVIGMAESEINTDKPSRHGVAVRNYKLHAMLLHYFKEEWDLAETFEKFLCSVVSEKVREDPTKFPLAMIAEQVGVDVEEVEKCFPDGPEEGEA